MKLKNKIALVTGAGSGIGRAVAFRFLEEGARVYVNDVARPKAEALARELGLDPERALVADVSNSSEVAKMFDALPLIDVLVNSAGFAEPEERWTELNRIAEARLDAPESVHWDVTLAMDDATWRRMLDVHLSGTFYCTREALKRMSPRERGAIVNLSSTAALTGLAAAPHYAAAKAGVLGFTRSVAREVASRGIRVNAVAPGYTETPMTAPISDRVRRDLEAAIPLGRWAEPREIAAVVLFLASEDASYVTGQCLSPNGGLVTG